MSDEPPNEEQARHDLSRSSEQNRRQSLLQRVRSLVHQQRLRASPDKHCIHLAALMCAAGLPYTDDRDTGRCEKCGLEVANWTLDIKPFTIHSKERPNCPFVRSMKRSLSVSTSSTINTRNTSISNEQDNPSKRQKIEIKDSHTLSYNLIETDLLKQVRRRTFSHWPHRTIPSATQMTEAGFFNCNINDRTICIYCNLICQQWTPHTDDPCEVHRTLSPNCTYVKAKLIRPAASSILILNENSTDANAGSDLLTSNTLDPSLSHEIVFTAACNPIYTEIPKRHATFTTWPNENLPSVDDLVRAGFFYTGTGTIVTCFYCNGSLQNWRANDNPMIEHARWFPRCAYAEQLCGHELYRKIQESKRAQQGRLKHFRIKLYFYCSERAKAKKLREKAGSDVMINNNLTMNNSQLTIPDEITLSRFVAARLDLPITKRLLDQNFKLSIIKKCWEDQLRLKQDDFVTECDLYIACVILRKQIEHMDGTRENIIIPSIRMTHIREQAQILVQRQAAATASSLNAARSTETITATTSTANDPGPLVDLTLSNSCVLCLTEKKELACIPCGHLATCVPCGHLLRSCPICRREVKAFVRIRIED